MIDHTSFNVAIIVWFYNCFVVGESEFLLVLSMIVPLQYILNENWLAS